MKRTTNITEQDRQLWVRFRQINGFHKPARTLPELEGEDATFVAAFIEGRLNTQEREAFERRLARDPDLLDRTIAARPAVEAAWAEDATAPASLTEAARRVTPAGTGPSAGVQACPQPRPVQGSRRMFPPMPRLFGPLLAGSVAACLFVAATAAIFVWWSEPDPAKLVELNQPEAIAEQHRGGKEPETAKAPAPTGTPATVTSPNGNSIFTDPDKTYFDGLDVD